MTESTTLQVIEERGWLRGFRNMVRKEHGDWWDTGRWFISCVIWTAVINGAFFAMTFLAPDMLKKPEIFDALGGFVGFWCTVAACGAVVRVQGAIISERESGTAAWTFSKPVSRSAFILSKILVHSVYFLLTVIVLQGVICYVHVWARIGSIPVIPFAAGLSIIALHTVFYLVLAVALGTFFQPRAWVIGIPLGVMMAQFFVDAIIRRDYPWLQLAEPMTLCKLASKVVAGVPLPDNWGVPMAATATYALVLLAAAIWRFNREEF